MILFFIILTISLILLANADKKKKTRSVDLNALGNKFSMSYSAYSPIPGLSEQVKQYFGEDWRVFLIKHHGRYELWQINFYDITAFALQSLSIDEQKKLAESFNLASQDDNNADYTILHQITLKLLREDRFSVNNMSIAYRTAIELSTQGTIGQRCLAAKPTLLPLPTTESKLSGESLPNKILMTHGKLQTVDERHFGDVNNSFYIFSASKGRDDNVISTLLTAAISNVDLQNDRENDVLSSDAMEPVLLNVVDGISGDVSEKVDELLDNLSEDKKTENGTNNVGNEANRGIVYISDEAEKISYGHNGHEIVHFSHPKTEGPLAIETLDVDRLLSGLNIDALFPKNDNMAPSIDPQPLLEYHWEKPSYDYEEYKLGKKYMEKMRLSQPQVSLLNKLSPVENVFTAVEGCCMQTIQVFLDTVKHLNQQLKKKETDTKTEVEYLCATARQIHKRTEEAHWYIYDGYGQSSLQTRMENDVYYTIFKRCENLVRSTWDHKRKVSGQFVPQITGLSDVFQERIGELVDKIMCEVATTIGSPDFDTELELNKQNPTRWKAKLNQIKHNIEIDGLEFFSAKVHTLFAENGRNPSVENIFFEASKIVASIDKIASLRFYLHYLHSDQQSDKIDDKQLGKTVQKGLFKNKVHEETFSAIVQQLKLDRNIEVAISKVESIYTPIRKKITLNHDMIKAVKEEDRSTVELLNNYLQDDDDPIEAEKNMELQSSAVLRDADMPLEQAKRDSMAFNVTISNEQRDLIAYFFEQGFCLSAEMLDAYCVARGRRRGFLVNSINEDCFEFLDDNLIEENEETYEMNDEYYKILISE